MKVKAKLVITAEVEFDTDYYKYINNDIGDRVFRCDKEFEDLPSPTANQVIESLKEDKDAIYTFIEDFLQGTDFTHTIEKIEG